MSNKRSKQKDICLASIPLGGARALFDQGLTIIHPYFGEEKRFNFMYDKYWTAYSEKIRRKLQVILVDDCGTPPIHTLLNNRDCNFNLTIYRIIDDLKYNTPGALNVGSVEAKTDFIFHMDSDCALEEDMLDTLMQQAPLHGWMYKFRRNRITENPDRKRLTRYLPCANLLHKDLFTVVRGFDEDFTGSRSGGYGFFDNHFDYKILKAGFKRAVIDGIIVTEYMESLVDDAKPVGPLGVGVHRTDTDNETNRYLYRRKQSSPELENPEILRFTYEKVYERII